MSGGARRDTIQILFPQRLSPHPTTHRLSQAHRLDSLTNPLPVPPRARCPPSRLHSALCSPAPRRLAHCLACAPRHRARLLAHHIGHHLARRLACILRRRTYSLPHLQLGSQSGTSNADPGCVAERLGFKLLSVLLAASAVAPAALTGATVTALASIVEALDAANAVFRA